MTDDISTEEARVALAQAEDAALRVRTQARWMSGYMGVFAAGFGATTLPMGLVQPAALAIAVWAPVWVALVVAMVTWSRQRRAALPRTGRRIAPYWIGTGLLFAAALFAGMPRFLGRPLYWTAAAAVVAAPLAVAAVRERRA